MKSKNFVFCENDEGTLDFVGDFEGLYQSDQDPWQQSGQGEMSEYYALNRSRLVQLLQVLKPHQIIEFGCGLGYTTALIASALPESKILGVDISETAITKAKNNFTTLDFEVGNICKPDWAKEKAAVDVLVLNQLLWYILEDLDIVFEHCYCLLMDGGHVVINNAFARTQKYGVDILDGYRGAIDYFKNLHGWHLKKICISDDGLEHIDGQFTLQKVCK